VHLESTSQCRRGEAQAHDVLPCDVVANQASGPWWTSSLANFTTRFTTERTRGTRPSHLRNPKGTVGRTVRFNPSD